MVKLIDYIRKLNPIQIIKKKTMTEVIVIVVLILAAKKAGAISLGTIAGTLLSHGLTPQSQLNSGHGAYLRDTFRQNTLIPTFRRIRDSLVELENVTFNSKIVIVFTLTIVTFAFMAVGLCIHALRTRIRIVEERARG